MINIKENELRALDIATNPGAIHEYNIDWKNLTDTSGATIRVDQDGDGTFERTVTGGTTLTVEQFQKITICHLPPGNPDNAQTISIGIPALKAHLKHGDYDGECKLSTGVAPKTITKPNQIDSSIDNNTPKRSKSKKK